MRYNYIFLLSITFLVFGSSCKKQNDFKIAFLLPNLVDDRVIVEREFFTTKIKELGGVPLISDAQFNDQLQITQALEMIAEGVNVLVVMPINKNTAAIVRIAHENNVKVIAYERIIANCNLDYFVSFDNIKVGEIMAGYVLRIRPKGKYIILNGDYNDQNAIWVREGMSKIIDPFVKSGDIKILYSVGIEDWSGENAYMETKQFLNLSMEIPDVILSAYDGMSRGAIKALEEINVKVMPVITGQNAELLSCKYIVNGIQSMTVYKPLKKEAELAAEVAMKCAKNEKIVTNSKVFNGFIDVPTLLIEPIGVDSSNIRNTIIKDGFFKEAEIFN